MKHWEWTLLAAFLLSFWSCCFWDFSLGCAEVREDTLRLHILANSDSAEDQQLKLMVRDRILEETADLFTETADHEGAVSAAEDALPKMLDAARSLLQEQGCDAPVSGEEPNCIKEGISRHYCLNEGCTVYRKEILPKTEHKYDDVTVVSATCVNNGYIRYACSEAECDASYDEYYKTNANGDKVLLYPMIDHDYRYVNVAPTCEKDGYTNCICNICNYSYVDANSFVPAKGHADKDGDGVCDTCKLDAVFGSCTCLCHSKNWFIRIIYIIVRFIWKLLKISPVCNCGVAHY